MTSFNDLLSQHIGSAFAKQLAFADLLGERDWSLSVQQGVCKFGDDLQFQVQLLGTEAEGDSTWLWAWANEASNLPPTLLRASNYLKNLGEKLQIQELTERSFPIEFASGHTISLIASGISANCAYYRGPYPGGAIFFLVSDVPEWIRAPVELARIVTVVTEAISQFDVDHRTMVESFLKSQAFVVTSTGQTTEGKRNDESILFAFDANQRLTKYETTISPKPPPKKSWQFWKK